MEIYDAMSTTRAVRRLRPDPIPSDVLGRILEAATWGPTGANAQPWRAIVVRHSAENKQRLAELYSRRWSAYTKHYQSLLKDAPAPVAEAARRMISAGDYLADHFAETPVIVVFCFNPKLMAITDADLGRASVVGGASIYPVVQNFLLACRAEGLGCVLTTLLCQDEPVVRELLEIPDPWYTAAVVPVGYPVGTGHGPLRRKPVGKMMYGEKWGDALVAHD